MTPNRPCGTHIPIGMPIRAPRKVAMVEPAWDPGHGSTSQLEIATSTLLDPTSEPVPVKEPLLGNAPSWRALRQFAVVVGGAVRVTLQVRLTVIPETVTRALPVP